MWGQLILPVDLSRGDPGVPAAAGTSAGTKCSPLMLASVVPEIQPRCAALSPVRRLEGDLRLDLPGALSWLRDCSVRTGTLLERNPLI